MKPLEQLKHDLKEEIANLGSPLLRDVLENIDALEQQVIHLQAELEGVDEQFNEINSTFESLKLQAQKISNERDAIAELHKQVIREILNGTHQTREKENNSSEILPS